MILDKNSRRKSENKRPIDPRCFLIMDDCMSSKHLWLKDPSVLSVFNEGRHYQLTFILAMQYSLGIQPELRSNFDYVFLLGEDFINNRKKLYEHYAGMFPTFDIFQQVFNEVTADYGCMVINNKIHSKKLEDKVFWYKAAPVPDFNIGNKTFKKYSKKNYDPKHNKRVPIFDPETALARKRNAINLIVEKI